MEWFFMWWLGLVGSGEKQVEQFGSLMVQLCLMVDEQPQVPLFQCWSERLRQWEELKQS